MNAPFTLLRFASFVTLTGTLLLGCQLFAVGSPWGDRKEEQSATAGEGECADCHDDVATVHRAGPHGAANIACGQCHRGGGHPDFSQPLDDGTCGGCHLPEYQQIAASAHARRGVRAAEARGSNSARFFVDVGGARYFAGDADAPRRSQHLCAACHFDEHRLSAAGARAAGFCQGCHRDLDRHPPLAAAREKDCVACHMQRGTTSSGRIVTSHAFAPPEEQPR